MKHIKSLKNLIITSVLTGLSTLGYVAICRAQQALQSTQTVTGQIDSSTPPVMVDRNYRPGQTYTFEVLPSDRIEIAANRLEGSTIDIMLVVQPPDRSPFSPVDKDLNGGNTERVVIESASAGGTWKVFVVSYNNIPGRYQLSLVIKRDGVVVKPEEKKSAGIQYLERNNMKRTACSSPDVVAVIDFQGEVVCTNDWPKGEWSYNPSTNNLDRKTPADPYLATIQSWGVTPVNCNSSTNLVRITFDPNKIYCIAPEPDTPAGDYTYDAQTNTLNPVSSIYYSPETYSAPSDGGNGVW